MVELAKTKYTYRLYKNTVNYTLSETTNSILLGTLEGTGDEALQLMELLHKMNADNFSTYYTIAME